MDTITQTCAITGQSFNVTSWEQDLLKKLGNYPPQTLHIEERRE